jgi:hypothetical protein
MRQELDTLLDSDHLSTPKIAARRPSEPARDSV